MIKKIDIKKYLCEYLLSFRHRISNKITLLSFFAICFLILSSTPALACVYYVSPLGNDSNSGISINEPLKNPSYAASIAVSGDTIYLMDGIWYDQHIVFNKKATPAIP